MSLIERVNPLQDYTVSIKINPIVNEGCGLRWSGLE